MSLYNFPGFASPENTSFHPLFRLLDDFDHYSQGTSGRHNRSQLKTFTPKFDVKEVSDVYELHGELPGIEQKDVEIEFTDENTLTIKGRAERHYQSGTPPAGFVEGPNSSGAITEAGENGHPKGHKATVEDEGAAAKEETTAVTKKEGQQAKGPQAKYWVSERSVGEFSRSFTFPDRVDLDSCKASMKNGILSVMVPKQKKHENRRKIAIN